jgi:ATP-dependent Clp protease protease subunit
LNEVLAKHSEKSVEQIERDSDRDYFMTAVEAKEYGIVDSVIERQIETEK